jgi:peroxiredoxin (alkyl hydroperoxide reductase subunit C)
MTASATTAPIAAMVGQPAPEFDLVSTKNLEKLNERVTLADYRNKWLILIFYPLDFSSVCPTELTAFSDRYDEFTELGADILGVSTDSAYAHRAWLQVPRHKNGVQGLRFPLASDLTKEATRRYGVLIEDKGIALRGLFVIDPEGVMSYKVVHDYDVGRSADETLRVVQALQTGSLCPAEWRPGRKTLE